MWNWKLKQASKSSRGSSCTRKIEDNCADFISELPDQLLLHIFSFLDETAVFRSSVLSKRWHYLWTLVPFPMAIKERRSYLKEQKADIFKEKISKEEEAAATILTLAIDIAIFILQFFFSGLPFIWLEFKVFAVIHPLLTLVFIILLHLFYCMRHLTVCDNEVYLKRLQVRDSKLTSNANSHSTTNIPRMELLFPENYKPKYSKYVKLCCLIGMLLSLIISCSLFTLKWKFDFKHGTDMWFVTSLVSLSISIGIGTGWFLSCEEIMSFVVLEEIVL